MIYVYGTSTTEYNYTTFAVTGAFTISSYTGFVGETPTVTGSGFPAGTVSFYWDGAATSFASLTASGTGTISGTITIPAAARGDHTITTSPTLSPTSRTFTVKSQITLAPTSGGAGDAVSVTGSGFAASSTVTISVDGVPVAATSPPSINTNPTGGFTCSFVMPTAASGNRIIRAADSGGNAEATFVVGPKITLSPTSGSVGDNVIINGNGFSANKTITFTIDPTSPSAAGTALTVSPSTVTSDASGAFSNVSFVIPPVSGGTHTIRATDPDGHYKDTTLTVVAKISITPASGTVGTQITVTGSGFALSPTPVSIYWDSGTTPITTTTATPTGTISVTFTSPASAKGNHTVKAQDTAATPNSATASFSTTPKIVLSPTSGSFGDSISITFTGFTASSTITPLSILSGTNLYSIVSTPTTTPIDANGGGSATFSVPNVYYGNWTVQAADSSGGSAQATLVVTQKITLNISTGVAGEQITVTGTGFTANKGIALKYNGVALATSPSVVTSNADGAFACLFTIPETPAGSITLTVSDGNNVATASFTATAKATISKVTTQTDPGYVGMDMTISGTGFKAASNITVTFESTPVTVTTVKSDDKGSFTATFKVPVATSGNHTIKVTDGTTTKEFAFFMDSTAPAAPALVTPVDKFKPKQPVPFSWNAVTDPSGVTYTFQISQDVAFNTLVLEKKDLTATIYTMTVAEKLKSAGSKTPYYWRVRATDAAGNVGDWSTSNTFTIGFIWPTWIIHVWYGLGIVVALILGLWLGRRMAYQSY